MKNTQKISRFLISGFVALLLGMHSAGAFEKNDSRYKVGPERELELKYDVYAGGFNVMETSFDFDMKPKAYHLTLDSHTQGFIGQLFPWKGNYTTDGHPDKNIMPVPSKHVAVTTWKGTETSKQMEYDVLGNLTKFTTTSKGQDTVKTDTAKELYAGSVDLLSAMMMMIETVNRTNKCDGSYPVFDGKRRFDIKLSDEGVETLPKSKYSKFEGEALHCTIKVDPVGGFEKKDKKRGWMAVQAHTEERNHPPAIWFGKMPDDGQYVPVRMEIASAYGTVVASITNNPGKAPKK